MQLGIMSGTLVRDSLESRLDAVREYGFSCVQFSLACAGLPPMPDAIEPAVADHIREEMLRRQIEMAAVSGTYNMIHPDPAERQRGLQRLQVLADAAGQLGTTIKYVAEAPGQ
ncbi:MAG: sugar phosphate isomerase/epimerase [Chloroflexi bacterium]|nr:sugar phosphate isomerase/epimerase [Chloroflexota bacterium]